MLDKAPFNPQMFANSVMTLVQSHQKQSQDLVAELVNTITGLNQQLEDANAKAIEQAELIKTLSGEAGTKE